MKDREAASSQENKKDSEKEAEHTIKQKQVFESRAGEVAPSFREAERFEEQAQFIETPHDKEEEVLTDEVIDNEVASSLSERSGLFENSSKRTVKPRWSVLAKLIIMGLFISIILPFIFSVVIIILIITWTFRNNGVTKPIP